MDTARDTDRPVTRILADGHVVDCASIGGDPGVRFPNDLVDRLDVARGDQIAIDPSHGDDNHVLLIFPE